MDRKLQTLILLIFIMHLPYLKLPMEMLKRVYLLQLTEDMIQIVPHDNLILASKDHIHIHIDKIGTLLNKVE